MFVEIPVNNKSHSKRMLLYGVGLNDAPYKIERRYKNKRYICPIYGIWKTMLQRVYSKKWKERYPTYTDCTVCTDWLVFSVFKEWVLQHDWAGKDLDKDLKVKNNKIYSPDTCLFIPQDVNKLVMYPKRKKNSALPIGVFKSKNSFMVRMSIYGKDTYLGSFNCPKKAGKYYLKEKSKHVLEVSLSQPTDIRIALERISTEILNSEYYGN